MPSRLKRGQNVVELPASLSAKVLLLNEMVTQKVWPTELARMLNMAPQEANRLTNLRHTPGLIALIWRFGLWEDALKSVLYKQMPFRRTAFCWFKGF